MNCCSLHPQYVCNRPFSVSLLYRFAETTNNQEVSLCIGMYFALLFGLYIEYVPICDFTVMSIIRYPDI